LGSSQKWKTFESKEWGFKVKYPAEWEIWEEGIRTIGKEDFFCFLCGPVEFTYGGPFTDVIFSVKIGEARGKSAEELWEDHLTQVRPLMPENVFYKEKRANFTLGEMPAFEVDWVLKKPDSHEKGKYSLTQKGKNVITVKEDKYYNAAFDAVPLEEYNKWIKEANRIFSSFEFI
jgi:hypothetical protein